MSIFDETGVAESITEGSRALRLFTDRVHFVRDFVEYIHADPPPRKILFFHGDGGNGKSLLLRYLRDRCCHRLAPENWEYVRVMDDDDFIDNLTNAEGAEPAAVGFLDFADKPQGENRPQEAFSALLMLRRQLAGRDLTFPLFDFACLWYLHQEKLLTQERLRSLFPSDELSLIGELAGTLVNFEWISVAAEIIKVFDRRLGRPFTLYRERRGLDPARVQELQGLDHRSELLARLPRLFADDLKAALTQSVAPPRVVLFFDTHEAVWGHERHLSPDRHHERDQWLRRLIGSLDLSRVVVVVAGREPPAWPRDPDPSTRIPADSLDLQHVEELTVTDAARYLQRAFAHTSPLDPALQDRVIAFASVAHDRVHPLLLGLCADVVLQARSRGVTVSPADFTHAPDVAERADTLIERLLRYVDRNVRDAVRALCACRAFDRALYSHLGAALDFRTSRADFDTLVNFSFVRPAADAGSYRLHDLLRRLLRKKGDCFVGEADVVLEAYYRSPPDDDTARAEAIYHANQLDPDRAIKEWIGLFESAHERSDVGRCRVLVALQDELTIPNDERLGRILMNIGQFYEILSEYESAARSYRDAIAAYDRVLATTSTDASIYNNRGGAYLKLGELQSAGSELVDAAESLGHASADFNTALTYEPEHPDILNNLGGAFGALGELREQLRDEAGMTDAFDNALIASDRVLTLYPDIPAYYHNHGGILRARGEQELRRGNQNGAEEYFASAISAYDHALALDANHPKVHNNRGAVLRALGELRALTGMEDLAEADFQAALASFERASELAPDHPSAHDNCGVLLGTLSAFHVDRSDFTAAEATLQQALSAQNRALALAPNDSSFNGNRGLTYFALGNVHWLQDASNDGLLYYRAALADFERAIQLAPEFKAYVLAREEVRRLIRDCGGDPDAPLDAET